MNCLLNSHSLRAAMAAVTLSSPLLAAEAEVAAAAKWLTPQSVAAVTVRLAEAASTPFAADYPVEVLQAFTEDYLGIPLEAIERVTLVVDPPMGITPQFAVVVNADRPVAFDAFRAEVVKGTTETDLGGMKFLANERPDGPSFLQLDEQSFAFGPKAYLKRLAKHPDALATELSVAMSGDEAKANHLHAAVVFGPLRPLIQIALSQAKSEAPPETHKYFAAADLVSSAVLTCDFGLERPTRLTAHTSSPTDADRLGALLSEGVDELRSRFFNGADGEFRRLEEGDDRVGRAWASYLKRSFNKQVELNLPRRDGDTAFLVGVIDPEEAAYLLQSQAMIGILVGLLLPAVQAAREAARRNQSMNNLKQIALALHNYHDVNNHFPPHAIYSADGKPLLSWRVAILPYVEEQGLYEKFHLDEPWDSPHNKTLLTEIPEVFVDPSSTRDDGLGIADYLAVVGPKAAFSGGPRGLTFVNFRDGTAKTVMLVQVNDEKGVEWTKPADYDAVANDANPIGGIQSMHPGVFLGGFADGHVQAIPMDTAPETLRALMTINGGEPVELP